VIDCVGRAFRGVADVFGSLVCRFSGALERPLVLGSREQQRTKSVASVFMLNLLPIAIEGQLVMPG